jgi:hypothetical protein
MSSMVWMASQASFTFGLVRGGVVACHVAWAAVDDLVRDRDVVDVLEGVDQFQDAAPFARAEVVVHPAGLFLQLAQGCRMAPGQVHHMDEVADIGAVGVS